MQQASEVRGYTPAPYTADADETVACPSCGRGNDTDAKFCDQCDYPLAPAASYSPDPDETVKCPNCGCMDDADAHYCDQCGVRLEGRDDVMVTGEPDEVDDQVSNPLASAVPVAGATDVTGFEGGVTVGYNSKSVAPKENLVRDASTGGEFRDDTSGEFAGILSGIFSRYSQWYEISSFFEGDFIENTAPGCFANTMVQDRANMRVLFDHGFDPTLGNKPLGPILDLRDTAEGPHYDVGLANTDYNRGTMVPLLRGELMNGDVVGSLLGSSFRFEVLRESWNMKPAASSYNPTALPERTILEARVFEFGPVTFPANPGATAIARSRSDDWLRRLHDDEHFFASFSDRVGHRVARALRSTVPKELLHAAAREAQRQAWDDARRRARAILALSKTG